MAVALSERFGVEYLTHYYLTGTPPLRSLLAMPPRRAIQLMKNLAAVEKSAFDTSSSRFSDPAQYLLDRRYTERWVRERFLTKGGRPAETCAIYAVLGNCKWWTNLIGTGFSTVRIPLADFAEEDISFTCPDSFVSLFLSRNTHHELYRSELHGKVFTRSEVLALVESKGLPEETWGDSFPSCQYIEAQIWNGVPLKKWYPTDT